MTRILLPLLIAIVGVLGLMTVVPIAIREFFGRRVYERELDEWAKDIR